MPLLLALSLLTASSPALRGFEERTGIAVRCAGPTCPAWSAEALADFDGVLAALPSGLRRPSRRLTLVLHPTSMPFGMGDGSALRPEWSSDGAAFHVYGYEDPTEERARWRTLALPAALRASLWRRRALVHALLARADDRLHLSERPAWRRLSSWTRPLDNPPRFVERPLNVFEGAYSRARGLASARLDLLTFAEEHFVPVEALVEDALARDDTIACQELSKSRVLHTLLFEVGLAEGPYRRPRCPAFDGWAALDRLEALEVMMVASSGRRPESLFGHLLLRPVHRPGALVRGPSFESAVQIAAITDGPEVGPVYLYRGIFGGYQMAVLTLSRRDLEREVLEEEQRSIRRFRLALTPEENERVMERVWDLERRGYFVYRFFTANCATTLAALLEGALPEDLQLTMPGLLITSPTSALDGLGRIARERGGRRVPLLQRVDVDVEPSGLLAERAEVERGALELQLQRARPSLTPLFADARSKAPASRAVAYRALAAHAPRAPAEARAWYQWWRASVQLERHGVDQARKALAALDLATIEEPLLPTPPDRQLRERQARFARESRLGRHLAELDRAEAARLGLAHLRRRPLTPDERAEQAAHARTIALFELLTTLHGDVIERDHPDIDPLAVEAELRAQRQTAQRRWERRALASSGTWRLAVGLAAATHAQGQLLARVHSGAMSERLGDQRLRGFQPSTELRVLDGDMIFGFDGVRPVAREGSFELFAWRSLGRTAPLLRQSLREAFGYGLALGTERREGRALSDRLRLDAEAFAVVDESETFERHLALGLGPRATLGTGPGGEAASVGPRVVVAQRAPLGGHSANALRVDGAFSPQLYAGAIRGVRYEAQIGLEADARLGWGEAVILLRPRAQLEVDLDRRGAPLRRSFTASLLIEPVEWNLRP